MIFYFSGTGNSQWIAKSIASSINDTAFDIALSTQPPDICNQQYIGFVFPIYAWGTPEPMLAFVKKLQHTTAFTFAICTCGADAGSALKKFSKHYHLDSSYSVIMPSNYIVGSDLEDEQVIAKKIAQATVQVDQIAKELLQKKCVYQVSEGALPALKSNFAHWGFNKFARTTKPFFATDQCIGCKLCQNQCPSKTITVVNGKPTWDSQCFQCLRCINNCPKTAIQYGKATKQRGRYTLNKYL